MMRTSYFSISFGILLILKLALLEATWVDPDTSEHAKTTRALYPEDSRKYELVFSDEFEQDGRSFHDGNDPRWTAIHKNDCELTKSCVSLAVLKRKDLSPDAEGRLCTI